MTVTSGGSGCGGPNPPSASTIRSGSSSVSIGWFSFLSSARALGAYLEEVRRGCVRHNVDYALIRTSQALDAALTAFLSHRLGKDHRT